jgi:hypothetical protein
MTFSNAKASSLEVGVVFRVDFISDGLLLRSGNTAWSLTRLSEAAAKQITAEKPAKEAPAVAPPATDPAHPRPRPEVVKQQKTRPAIFTENKFGTSNIGPVAYDARWSNYGAYLQRLIDTVQIQWENILISGKVYPPGGSTVSVTFIIDSDGKISRIVNVENKSTDQAAHACVNAITDRAPYGKWTDDMIAMLGQQQEMTLTFYYQ